MCYAIFCLILACCHFCDETLKVHSRFSKPDLFNRNPYRMNSHSYQWWLNQAIYYMCLCEDSSIFKIPMGLKDNLPLTGGRFAPQVGVLPRLINKSKFQISKCIFTRNNLSRTQLKATIKCIIQHCNCQNKQVSLIIIKCFA